MITVSESILIAGAIVVFALGGVFGTLWWAFLKRLFSSPRKHHCPHCGSIRVRFVTDWHAETVGQDDVGFSETASEFICTECHKTHWV
jgi:uncharacterized protein with PIN domain